MDDLVQAAGVFVAIYLVMGLYAGVMAYAVITDPAFLDGFAEGERKEVYRKRFTFALRVMFTWPQAWANITKLNDSE